MSAKVDISPASIVVWCDLCPSFASVEADGSRAHDLAVKHEQAVHPSLHSAEENRNYYRRKTRQHA